MALKIGEEQSVQMPMKTVASLIALVALGTWAYFGVIETLNKHSTKLELMEKDLEANSEFRVKYPRGELGQSSGESELFMLMEHMSGVVKDIETELKSMRNNSININFLKEQVTKLNEDVESLKDADRDMKYINGDKDEWSK
tara:strand:+ start:86 stop:511 length:426 start_codon:yes stop_codon:yes gene_type:complete